MIFRTAATLMGTLLASAVIYANPAISVKGWPDYLAMGAVTNANTTDPGQLQGRNVDAIFKYAGDGGNGDPGKIILPIYTLNTIKLAQDLSTLNHHTVKPVMVVYTAQMSGGVSYQDFTSPDLAMHFVNLMLVAQTLQSAKSTGNDVGSIVLNPDLMGMVQQANLYNKSNDPSLKPLKDLSIPVQKALAKAYWFVTTDHNWQLKLGSGKIVKVNNATPFAALQQAANGDLKPEGIYSPWDIKTSWEQQAVAIFNQAPSTAGSSLPHFNNSFKGWIQANNWAIKKLGPNVTFGWQENVWNTGSANWVHKTLTNQQIDSEITTPTVNLWRELAIYSGQYKPDFLVFDKYEMDAIPAAAAIGYAWNALDWTHYITYVRQMSNALNKIPVMLWQIPGGHLQIVGDVDKRSSHASTAPDYFFGAPDLQSTPQSGITNLKPYINAITLKDSIYNCQQTGCSIDKYLVKGQFTWHKSHLSKALAANVFAILWGGGNTTSVGTVPFSDGGWLASRVNSYEKNPLYL